MLRRFAPTSGGGQTEAARRFKVGEASVYRERAPQDGMDPEKQRPATKSVAHSNDEAFCVFVSGIVVMASSLCILMRAASSLPSHAAMEMRPSASTWMTGSSNTDALAPH